MRGYPQQGQRPPPAAPPGSSPVAPNPASFSSGGGPTYLQQQIAVAHGSEVPHQGRRRNSGRSALASSSSDEGTWRRTSNRGVHFESAPNEHQGTSGLLFSDNLKVSEAKGNHGVASSTMAKLPMTAKELTTELNNWCPTLTAANIQAIEEAIEALRRLIQQCALRCAGSNVPPGADAGELLPVGAWHLGVAGPGDAIDLVYLAPPHINLQDLHTLLGKEIQQKSGMPLGVNADGPLQAPGFQLTWQGIKMVLFLSLHIPDLPLPSMEGGVVQNTVGSLAYEVSQKLLTCVPNAELFRSLLRFVRFWAKRRGIYGKEFGFFSGTVWAICCACVCQHCPQLQLPQLVVHFFRIMTRWDWSSPVSIQMASSGIGIEQKPGFDPECPMPVMLPAGCGLLATKNVSQTTMKIMQKELRRGVKTAKQVELFRVHWSDVCNPARFFHRHRHYLEFDFMAANPDVFAAWKVWARQQLQGVVKLFESTSGDIVSLRPWPEFLDYKDDNWPHAAAVFYGLHLERGGKDGTSNKKRTSFDLREPVVKFLEGVAAWPDVEKYQDQFELEVRHIKIDQLEQWLENREKGVVAHVSAPPLDGLFLHTVWEKQHECPDPGDPDDLLGNPER